MHIGEVNNVKKVIGIISIVLFAVIIFQSCAVGVANTLQDSKEVSGTAGFMLALCMLIGGIIALVSKLSKGMTITSLVFYTIGGVVGIANVGKFADLKIWSILSFIFAALLLFDLIKNKAKYNNKEVKA